jgi:hypothetical protein
LRWNLENFFWLDWPGAMILPILASCLLGWQVHTTAPTIGWDGIVQTPYPGWPQATSSQSQPPK